MGIKYLQPYIERNCPDGITQLNLLDLIKTEVSVSGKRCVVVLDFPTSVFSLYKGFNWICGGQLIEFTESLRQFIMTITEAGADLVVFDEGVRNNHKIDKWKTQAIKKAKSIHRLNHLLREIGRKNVKSKLFEMCIPASVFIAAKNVFLSMDHCSVRTPVLERNEEISLFAKENKCLALIAQDSDYLIFGGAKHYLSSKRLNLRTLDCMEYNRNSLLSKLQLNESQIALFALLVGNDVIPYEEYEPFIRKLCRQERGRIELPVYFSEVAKYTKTIKMDKKLNECIEDISNLVFGNKNKAELLSLVYKTYRLENKYVMEEPKTPWDELVSTAYELYKRGQIPSVAYLVMIGKPFYGKSDAEDVMDTCMPSAHTFLRPLRRRIYGILFYEKEEDTVFVREICVEISGTADRSVINDVEVTPQPPLVHHPGLRPLWQDESAETLEYRWGLFCSTLSESLLPQEVQKLPPTMVFPALAMYYMLREIETPFLEMFEVRAFFVQAIKLQDQSIKPKKLQIADVHISCSQIAAKLNVVLTMLDFLNGVCGFPVPREKACPSNYFDGQAFLLMYTTMQSDPDYDLNFKTEDEELYNRLIKFVSA